MLIFAGCAAVAVNLRTGGTVTFPGICITWGLTVMVMVYSVGHISGAHFNPAVTFAFATCGRFPWKQVGRSCRNCTYCRSSVGTFSVSRCLLLMVVQVPAYAAAQLLGSTAASITLRLIFGTEHFFGTVPAGSDVQSLVLEFIITFYLMFVVSGVATDNRAVSTDPLESCANYIFHIHTEFCFQTSGLFPQFCEIPKDKFDLFSNRLNATSSFQDFN
jgi:aquaporin NIP